MKYAGIPYRICTSAADRWWIEERDNGVWKKVIEEYYMPSVHRDYHTRPVAYKTQQACKDWIDERVKYWIEQETARLANAAHVAANPPMVYP